MNSHPIGDPEVDRQLLIRLEVPADADHHQPHLRQLER